MKKKVVVALLLLACGTDKTPDAGSDASQDASTIADASDASEASAMDGGCQVITCDGSITCSVGQTCAVGDGCNVCICRVDAGVFFTNCTAHNCSCSNPADF